MQGILSIELILEFVGKEITVYCDIITEMSRIQRKWEYLMRKRQISCIKVESTFTGSKLALLSLVLELKW
jgi:hypothetical protein